jgi:hypothetical protein
MKLHRQFPFALRTGRRARLVAVFLAIDLFQGPAAWTQPLQQPEPPQILKLKLNDPYLAFEFEDQSDKLRFHDPAGSSEDRTTDYTPSAGVSFSGSIYHPTVAMFSGIVEEGLTLGRRKFGSNGDTTTQKQDFELQRYGLDLTLLREKPFLINLYANRSQDRRDYGDFQSFTTHSDGYGTRLGYRAGPVPITFNAGRWTESVDNPDRPSSRTEDTVNFSAQNHRYLRDSTTLSYTFNEYRQEENNALSNQGHSQTLSLNDSEYFGKADRNRLTSSLYFNSIDSQLSQTRSVNLREGLGLSHSSHLSSDYSYAFDYNTAGGSDNYRNTVEAGLTHRFTASLESRIGALAETSTSSGSDGSGQRYERYGPRASETYNKRLSTWGHLRLFAGVDYFRESQHSQGGGALSVIDEQIRLADGQPAILGRPNVDPASILVTDRGGTTVYSQGFDYLVVSRGNFTEIDRVFGGHIPNGSTVSVSYNAFATPDGTVDTLQSDEGAEINFLKDLLALYVTHRKANSTGGQSLTFQEFDDLVAGARANYGWIGGGYEHGEHTASELDYNSDHTYEQLNIPLGDGVSLTLDAGQSRINYPALNEVSKIDTYSARCQARLLSSLWANALVGTYHQTTSSTTRDVKNAEAGFTFRYAKFNLRLSYRFEDEDNSGEKRERNWVDMRAERHF